MHAEFDLRSPLDVQGAFWTPGQLDDKFTGRLARSRRGVELTTSPTLKAVDPRHFFQNQEVFTPVLHGQTTKGPCTLLTLQSPLEDGLQDLVSGRSVVFRQFRVGLCILGMHLPDASTPFIESARFSYSSLQEWIRRPPIFSQTSEAIILTHRRNDPAVFDVCSVGIRSRITLDIIPRLHTRSSGEHRTKNESQLVIEPSQPQSVEWFLDLGNRFENLFSLLLGTSVVLQSVGLENGDMTGWVLRRVRAKPDKPDLRMWIACDGSQLARSVLRWLSTPQEFRLLENLVYWTLRKSSLFPETEFLSLAQAVESFHRLTDSSTVTHPSCFSKALRSLRHEIRIECGESALATRLNESIEHANEPNFRSRVEELLSRVPENLCQKLLGDPKEFEQTLRQTRHFFTHLGIKKKAKVLSGARDVFLFNQKLHALLRLLMLIHIGFPADQVFDPVYQQSRKWH